MAHHVHVHVCVSGARCHAAQPLTPQGVSLSEGRQHMQPDGRKSKGRGTVKPAAPHQLALSSALAWAGDCPASLLICLPIPHPGA